MSQPDLSIIIPSYNEALNLPYVIQDIKNELSCNHSHLTYEIIVIDDGSCDTTQKVLRDLTQKNECIRVLTHSTNYGYGKAISTGFEASKGKYVSVLPADGEVPAKSLMELYQLIDEKCYILSSRQADSVKTEQNVRPLKRVILSFWLRVLSILILGVDPKNKEGIFVIHGDTLRSFNIKSKTGLAHLEVIMYLKKTDLKCYSGVMKYKDRISGSSKIANLKNILNYLHELLCIRFR